MKYAGNFIDFLQKEGPTEVHLSRGRRTTSASRDCDIQGPAPAKSVKLEACLFTAACCPAAKSQLPWQPVLQTSFLSN